MSQTLLFTNETGITVHKSLVLLLALLTNTYSLINTQIFGNTLNETYRLNIVGLHIVINSVAKSSYQHKI